MSLLDRILVLPWVARHPKLGVAILMTLAGFTVGVAMLGVWSQLKDLGLLDTKYSEGASSGNAMGATDANGGPKMPQPAKLTPLSAEILRDLTAADGYARMGPQGTQPALKLYREAVKKLSPSALPSEDWETLKRAETDYKASHYADALVKFQSVLAPTVRGASGQ